MAKESYIGVNGTVKKVKEVYIGVNGIARKVKEVYIGVNGIPKCVYQSAIKTKLSISSNVALETKLSGTVGEQFFSISDEIDYTTDAVIVLTFSPSVCLYGGSMDGFIETTSDKRNTDYHVYFSDGTKEALLGNGRTDVEYSFPKDKLISQIAIHCTYSGNEPDTTNADFWISFPKNIQVTN